MRASWLQYNTIGYLLLVVLVGLLDQWMIEGKFTNDEALLQSYDMLSAGIDTVKKGN